MTKSSHKRTKLIGFIWLMVATWLLLVFLKIVQIQPYVNNASYDELYPPGTTQSYGINKWFQVATIYSPKELKSASEWVSREIGLSEYDNDGKRFLAIGNWIQRSLAENPRQQPTDSFSQLPILTQFKKASKNNEPIWCGNFASFGLLFLTTNGLFTRYIEIINGASPHVLTETYVPEWRQWVVTDFMNQLILARMDSSRYLNAADLLQLTVNNPAQQIEIAGFDSLGQLAWRKIPISTWSPYLNPDAKLLYFHTLDLKKAYRVSEKIKRYIYPAVWYDTYSLKPVSNTGYFLRLISIYLFFIVSMAFLISFWHDRSKKYS